MSLHDLGKTTLETYLLQHHIWLTSNAKTLLTIVPDWPKLNFFIATIIFFVCSKELYRLTMTLRGMVLPDDPKIAWNNMMGGAIFLSIYYVAATVLVELEFGDWQGILTLTLIMALVTIASISVLRVQATEHPAFFTICSRTSTFISIAIVALITSRYMGASSAFPSRDILNTADGTTPVSESAKRALASMGQAGLASNVPHECIESLNRGQWEGDGADEVWAWRDAPGHCGLQIYDTAAVRLFTRKESNLCRRFHHQANLPRICQAPGSYLVPPRAESTRHANQERNVKSSDTHVSFLWAPYTSDLQKVVERVNKRDDIDGEFHCDTLVIGAGLWDALWRGDEATPGNTEKYQRQVQELAKVLAWSNTGLTSEDTAFAKEKEGELLATNSKAKSEMEKVAEAAAAAVTVRLGHFFKDGPNNVFASDPEPSVPVTVWMQPTTILDDKLNTDRKKQYMTEAVVDKYRQANNGLWGAGANVILYPGRSVTPNRERAASSLDGGALWDSGVLCNGTDGCELLCPAQFTSAHPGT